MKLIDGITAFFTTVFDTVFSYFGLLKKGIEFIVNNRIAMVALIVTVVKGVYDFIVIQIDTALASFQGMTSDLTTVENPSGVAEFLAFGNAIFPISETLMIVVLLFELLIVCAVIKLILRLIPTI